MKKIFTLLIFILLINIKTIDASYQNYEEIFLEKGKFLDDFTKKDYDYYYKKLGKQKFVGWKVYTINDKVPFTYKKETLFSYYNDGNTAIEYDYEYKYKKQTKTSINYSGNLQVTVKGTVKKFSTGLENKINWDFSNQNTTEEDEKVTLKILIDPGTMVNLYITGKGYLTNGVAKNYIFFITSEKGGFELIKNTTEYHRLEKIKIR